MAGWVLIVASRVVLYVEYVNRNPTLFVTLFFFDIGLHSLYFYFKMTKLRMEEVSVFLGKHNPETWLRRVNKESELEVYHGDYFIFADYVYRLGPVLGAHPGGFEIINESRGREVDRFIYGMEPMEMYESLPRVSHSARSIELAGLPVAKLEEAALYPKMNENTKCKITGINFYQSSKRIYTVYLRPTE